MSYCIPAPQAFRFSLYSLMLLFVIVSASISAFARPPDNIAPSTSPLTFGPLTEFGRQFMTDDLGHSSAIVYINTAYPLSLDEQQSVRHWLASNAIVILDGTSANSDDIQRISTEIGGIGMEGSVLMLRKSQEGTPEYKSLQWFDYTTPLVGAQSDQASLGKLAIETHRMIKPWRQSPHFRARLTQNEKSSPWKPEVSIPVEIRQIGFPCMVGNHYRGNGITGSSSWRGGLKDACDNDASVSLFYIVDLIRSSSIDNGTTDDAKYVRITMDPSSAGGAGWHLTDKPRHKHTWFQSWANRITWFGPVADRYSVSLEPLDPDVSLYHAIPDNQAKYSTIKSVSSVSVGVSLSALVDNNIWNIWKDKNIGDDSCEKPQQGENKEEGDVEMVEVVDMVVKEVNTDTNKDTINSGSEQNSDADKQTSDTIEKVLEITKTDDTGKEAEAEAEAAESSSALNNNVESSAILQDLTNDTGKNDQILHGEAHDPLALPNHKGSGNLDDFPVADPSSASNPSASNPSVDDSPVDDSPSESNPPVDDSSSNSNLEMTEGPFLEFKPTDSEPVVSDCDYDFDEGGSNHCVTKPGMYVAFSTYPSEVGGFYDATSVPSSEDGDDSRLHSIVEESESESESENKNNKEVDLNEKLHAYFSNKITHFANAFALSTGLHSKEKSFKGFPSSKAPNSPQTRSFLSIRPSVAYSSSRKITYRNHEYEVYNRSRSGSRGDMAAWEWSRGFERDSDSWRTNNTAPLWCGDWFFSDHVFSPIAYTGFSPGFSATFMVSGDKTGHSKIRFTSSVTPVALGGRVQYMGLHQKYAPHSQRGSNHSLTQILSIDWDSTVFAKETPISLKSYRKSLYTDSCLTAHISAIGIDGTVNVGQCDSQKHQTWGLDAEQRLHSFAAYDYCLSRKGDDSVILSHCDHSSAQKWIWVNKRFASMQGGYLSILADDDSDDSDDSDGSGYNDESNESNDSRDDGELVISKAASRTYWRSVIRPIDISDALNISDVTDVTDVTTGE
ncbi:MAG: leukocidin family pore-forming toxin [Endozoicomonadaceae bacterium]|nr:leukocidin family pore-forming toxin [Endozoicomonadaceae bacterium]